MTILSPIVLGGLVIGILIGYLARRWVALNQKESIERKAQEELRGAEAKSKEIALKAEEKATSILRSAQDDERARKQELRKLEERIRSKEDAIEGEKREVENAKKVQGEEMERIKQIEKEAKEVQSKAVHELERVSGLGKEEAKEALLKELEDMHKEEVGEMLVRFEKEKDENISDMGTNGQPD